MDYSKLFRVMKGKKKEAKKYTTCIWFDQAENHHCQNKHGAYDDWNKH